MKVGDFVRCTEDHLARQPSTFIAHTKGEYGRIVAIYPANRFSKVDEASVKFKNPIPSSEHGRWHDTHVPIIVETSTLIVISEEERKRAKMTTKLGKKFM